VRSSRRQNNTSIVKRYKETNKPVDDGGKKATTKQIMLDKS
jgi:hypothetical protein